MSSFRDSPYPVAHTQWVEGVKAPTNCRRALYLMAPCIDEGVFNARINGECRVETAVSLILGYEGAVSYFAASITKGVFHGNFCYQETGYSKMAVMDEVVLGQVAQNPTISQIGDFTWANCRLGSTTIENGKFITSALSFF